MRLIHLLAKPFPLIEGVQKKFAAAFAFGVFVFLFLLFFKPFGIGMYIGQQLFLYALGFGGITFSVMFLNLLLLVRIFPSFFSEERWTVGKEIWTTLVHIAFIGLGNYLFATMLSITKASPGKLLYFEFISICIGIFPIVVWTLIKENRLLKQSRQEAQKFETVLHPVKSIPGTETELSKRKQEQTGEDANFAITFTSESENAIIKTVPEKVYFISSADNYIKIYLGEENEMVTKLLRSSLKRTEEDLKGHPQFYRCHRAYIVNLRKVKSVTGNARGLKLALENCPVEVPVSRLLNEDIREKLEQVHSR